MTKALLVLAAALSLLSSTASAGNGTFDKNCKGCHETAKGLLKTSPGKSFEERAAELDAFLIKHHAEDAVVRAELIGFLIFNPVIE